MLIDNTQLKIKDVDSRLLRRNWIPARLLPIVQAAKPPAKEEQPPQRPPKMKYTELPMYTTPHLDYKEYLEDQIRCPKRYEKLIHQKIVPHVKSYREYYCQNARDFVDEFRSMKKEAMAAINEKIGEFKSYMRHPDNIQQRIAVVTAGGMMGYCYAAKRGMPSRLFFTGLSLLATGSLCFPKETDIYFREFSYAVANVLVTGFNFFCGGNISLRTQVPCESDVLPAPPQRAKNKCPEWTFDKEFTKKPNDWAISRKW